MFVKKGLITSVLAMVLFFGFLTLNAPAKADFGILCLVDCVNQRSECLRECTGPGAGPYCASLCSLLYEGCVLSCGPE